ncbi:glutamate receptor U1-like [Apis dorsata]|uniref:glutamate receptor U1-like n=1 Tax=Apis dorsata TaxID=7462 RepID=UPI001292F3FE|nr:glutamate receptor U1-like [Apis dorsata]
MKKLMLLFVTIHVFIKPVHSVNGVIWNKKFENFVPIFSVPTFAKIDYEIKNQSRKEEITTFQGRRFRFACYEELNMVITEANGTRITGIIGEIWNILSEYLNFTLIPVVIDDRSVGITNSRGKYERGLLKIMQENKTDVISKMGAYNVRRKISQFTIPLWKTRYRLYIQQEVIHLPTWMLKLFSRKVWYSILITYLLLSTCSYLSQAINSIIMRENLKTDLRDHLFYNFGMICGQSYFPKNSNKSSRIVELWLGLFSCLIRTAFGALLIGYMSQTIFIPPFQDLDSLLDKSTYDILTLNGSLPYYLFDQKIFSVYEKASRLKRYIVMNSIEEMYKTICLSEKLYALYESEDVKMARGIYFCRLNPVGFSLFSSWIISGLSLNFKYKRSIDIGLLRLYEVGIMDLLKYRWIKSKNEEKELTKISEPIILEQIYLILLIFGSGFLMSFIILVFENLIFYCKN